jgi:hypothetical protein
MLNDNGGVKKKPVTTGNPQANAIVGRVHHVERNLFVRSNYCCSVTIA